MLFPLVNDGGYQFRLLLIRPDFQPDNSRPITLAHKLDTDIGEGRTTIEERRPARRALLLTQTCTLLLNGNGADDWRKGMAALGPLPVGMPLWVDALAPDQWGQRIYDAQKIVGFDPETGDHAIYTGPDLPESPTFPLYAPLIVGRWKERPTAEALTDALGHVAITLAEASPWTYRVTPHAQGSSWTAWPDFAPSVNDASDYGLELIQNAAAREPGLDRVNAAARWKQDARFTFPDRLAIRQALTFFTAQLGAVRAWSPVPAWFQPGADTDATPDNYTARFASDTLTLDFLSGSVAQAQIGFIQQIDTGDRAQALAGEFYLYQLKYQHDADNPERWTNCDEPLVVAGDGTYQPRQVAHQEIRRSLKPQDDSASITLDWRAGSLADDWLRGRLFGSVLLTIWKCDPDSPEDRGSAIYTGFVTSVKPKGNTLTIEATLFGALLKAKAPGYVFGPACNTYVFSGRCGLDESAHRSAGTSARADLSGDGKTLTVHGPSGWGDHGTGTYDDNWFALGLLRTGTGRTRIIVTILASTTSGGALVLKLARPLWADLIDASGQSVQLVPGCGRQYVTDCGTKFANQVNFQGMPFMPDQLAQVDVPTPKTPKK